MKKVVFSKKLFIAIVAVLFLATTAVSQDKIPLIGSKAPSFKAKTTNGKMTFPDDFGQSWKILFSHPQDFTPVCTSELLELAYMQSDFEKMGVKLAVISTDNLEQHFLWKKHIEELDYKDRGTQSVNFPIIDDSNAKASKTYGMLHEPTSTVKDVRGVFIIDSDNVIRSVNFYPMEIGRNINEIARTVEALQTADKEQVFTPANWKEGDDVLIPHFPYTKEQLADNPDLKNKFYNVGNRMWFKKTDK